MNLRPLNQTLVRATVTVAIGIVAIGIVGGDG
jgi:preprotein translocase subunit Sss1